MMRAAGFVFYTELLLLFRRSQAWLYPLGFFVMVISLFPLSFTSDAVFLEKFIPGCVWIAALLASLLSVETIFFTELEDGHLEQMVLSQIPLTLLVGAKLGAQWVAAELPLICLTPLIGWLFHLSLNAVLALCLSLLLGTPILTLIGSLGVALTLGLRHQGVFLGLLILPLATPILIFGGNLAQQSAQGFSVIGPLIFLSGLLILAMTLLPWTIAAALRMSLDD